MKASATTVTHEAGDCFVVAAELILDLPDAGVWLCHGQPRFRGVPTPGGIERGERFWHAWVETQTTVYDYSNGRELQTSIEAYYVIGQIDAFHVRRYTRRQAAALLIASGHNGPWGSVS